MSGNTSSRDKRARGKDRNDAGKNRQREGIKAKTITFRESDIVQRWMVTTEGCPLCAKIKRDLKKEFKTGKIKATDVGDEKGFEIVTQLGLQETPVFVVELVEGFPVTYIIDE